MSFRNLKEEFIHQVLKKDTTSKRTRGGDIRTRRLNRCEGVRSESHVSRKELLTEVIDGFNGFFKS